MAALLTSDTLYNGFIMAADNLAAHAELLNQLNVFPVADKDTGINMRASLEAVRQGLTPHPSAGALCREAAAILLEEARGNSGTILTLFFKGFAEALPTDTDPDSRALAHAFAAGARTACTGVTNPMPGTILTVAEKAAEAGQTFLKENDPALLMQRMADEAYAVLPLTCHQNPCLAHYGVIDAGALGFSMILDGFARAFRENEATSGEWADTSSDAVCSRHYEAFCRNISAINNTTSVYRPVLKMPTVDHAMTNLTTGEPTGQTLAGSATLAPVENGLTEPAPIANMSASLADPYATAFKYCTECVIGRAGEDKAAILTQQLSALGDCLIPAVGDDKIKIHLHTNQPEAVFFTASLCGPLLSTKVDNMLSGGSDRLTKPTVSLFMVEETLTADGLKSMGHEQVFARESGEEEAFKEALLQFSENAVVTLYTTLSLPDELTDAVPRIRYFSDDMTLMNYLFEL
ncbi:MAG: DAK2 domain-containing protein [Lachnospiraceae bacterium]|nr:DAK2 domain-containing protein [Lachnospiraceae bacterium]